MNLHQLKIFQTVARLGSYSRAAEELRISQPSVSIQVADLERSLGVDLFEQIGKRIYLTEAGRTLEEYARRILSLVDETQAALEDVQKLRRGRLIIGASTTPGTYILPPLLGDYKRNHPQVEVRLDIANSRRIQERLLRNELDLGVVGWSVTGKDLVVEPFLMDSLVAIAAAGHPLASRERVTLADLIREPLLVRERGTGTREAIEEAFARMNLTLTPVMELGSAEAIKQAVAANLGVSIISRFAVTLEVNAGLLGILPVEDLRIERPLYIVRHRDKRLTRAAQAFLDLLARSREIARV
ncbi:MAG: LysR family transcriptional regulator [Armatimonadetes bacterium]|nr:LysR family transcriptional regulator [Armatimonadota bacterium]